MGNQAKSYGVEGAFAPLSEMEIERREPGPRDVAIDVMFCGMCHTDLHFLSNDWGNSLYPMVPGHEIVGIVQQVGSEVSNFKKGDRVGVGCLVHSCGHCINCKAEQQQYCCNEVTLTYNSPDPTNNDRHTLGGYSSSIVVNEDFVLRIPDGLSLAGAAPLVCAGVTAYSPLKRYRLTEGKRVAILGLGGVGHIAVKIAAAMGGNVTVITTKENKLADALRLGAHASVTVDGLAHRPDLLGTFDIVLDTVAAPHDIHPYMSLLKLDGAFVVLGMPPESISVSPWALLQPRRILTGSLVGGIAETQEVLNFCATYHIECEAEIVSIRDAETARRRLEKGDVRYRFVMDLADITGETQADVELEEVL